MSTPTVTKLDTTRADVPFVRLINVELRKAVDTLAGRWMLIIIGVLTVLVDLIAVASLNAMNLDLRLSTLLWSQKNVMLPIELIPVRAVIVGMASQFVSIGLVLVLLAADRSISLNIALLPLVVVLQVMWLTGLTFDLTAP